MSIIVAWTVATILAGCLICHPFAFNWDKTILGGSCGDQVTSFTITGIINLATDIVVLLLPMQPLCQLQMALYKKVVLVSVFGLGLFTCVVSALRISVLSTMNFADITFTIPRANIFSGIEPCLAVVLASVPMMRPLLGRPAKTSYGSGQKPMNTDPKSAGPEGVNDDRFERLDDDTSHLWLRPMGLHHHADVLAAENMSIADEESLERHEADDGICSRGIQVKQSFHVSEKGGASQ
ncbi:hypothetical protein N0V95_008002 [Ascochyta clinopodiicola]|nr:hypothetical protein N0V95_008002 [Ascochyta clinopodiicola]